MRIIHYVKPLAGTRIKQARKNLGLSQLELSLKSGISQASIARIESNTQKNLRSDTVQRLAAALGIPLYQFWEEPEAIREEPAAYHAARMLPVVTLEQVRSTNKFFTADWSTKSYEPSLSSDARAFFLLSNNDISTPPILSENDLLLIEPGAGIQDGDMVLLFMDRLPAIGRVYFFPSHQILQPLVQEAPPLIFTSAKKRLQKIRMSRVGEIRKKL